MNTNIQTVLINMKRRARASILLTALVLMFALACEVQAQKPAGRITTDTSDAPLVKSLCGFENGHAKVNGTRLPYVTGDQGPPVVLLPGWPQTWWAFSKVMPALAKQYRVIAVDLRGMGSSEKPAAGYDKKTMAQDIYELVRRRRYEKVNIVGHDIGSMVAFSC